MKFLVVLAALVALCAGGATPLVPGDNRHYIEEGSPFFGTPDGFPQLVELKGPINAEMLKNGRSDVAFFTMTGDNNVAEITVYIHNSRAQELLKHMQRSKTNDS